MKWLSDHNINIDIKNVRMRMDGYSEKIDGFRLYAEIIVNRKCYYYMDIFEFGKLQQYLRSVIFNFKRIVDGLNS